MRTNNNKYGKDRGSFGRGRRQSLRSENGYCICNSCGYKESHQRGIPCYSINCPNCNKPIVRESGPQYLGHDSVNPNENLKKKNYPTINTDLCTGCNACVEACPLDAISIIDGKANITENKCHNCLICKKVCPVNAIE